MRVFEDAPYRMLCYAGWHTPAETPAWHGKHVHVKSNTDSTMSLAKAILLTVCMRSV